MTHLFTPFPVCGPLVPELRSSLNLNQPALHSIIPTMGYHTEFSGALKFTRKLTAPQLSHLKHFLRQDCREHPEWNAPDLTYIDLALLPDNSGIQWDGSEKTYQMPELVNVVIRLMCKNFPDFGLAGTMTDQGSDVGELWELYIDDDGFAKKRQLLVTEEIIACPHCFNSINLSHTDG